jgi:CubicO group peptidase (beta-lactamase class C family)
MRDGNIPSLTIAPVACGGVVWQDPYGYANVWAADTGNAECGLSERSTFAAMSSVALLVALQRRGIALDAPVASYLGGLAIRGEEAADPVTFRRVAHHRHTIANAALRR